MTTDKVTHAPEAKPARSKRGLRKVADAVKEDRPVLTPAETLVALRHARAKRDAGKKESDEYQADLISAMSKMTELELTEAGHRRLVVDLPDEGVTVEGVSVEQYPRTTNAAECAKLAKKLPAEVFERIMPRTPNLPALDAALTAGSITSRQYNRVVGAGISAKRFIDVNTRELVVAVVAAP